MKDGPGSSDPERFTVIDMPLLDIIEYAYDLKPHQYSSPSWMKEASFDITAKVRPGATREESKLMLQNLLLERFDLKFHIEPREMQRYELVIAKSGPKLNESAPLNVQPVGGLTVGSDGYPVLPSGNRTMTQVSPSGKVTMRAHADTAADIAKRISERLHRPVVDATGLSGKYDYVLKYDLTTDRLLSSSSSDGIGDPAGIADSGRGPGLATAIQEQLGLKVKPAKGLVPFFVIDYARKVPEEN